MGDILSQEEINALLAALPSEVPEEEGKSVGSGGGAVRTQEKLKHVKLYDFRHPDKFSKIQLHVMQIVHENIARILSTSFSVYLRSPTHFTVTSVDQKTYEEFVKLLPNPTTMMVFSLSPLEGNAVWEMNPSITFAMFDRLLGGTGIVHDEQRELTEIEQTVITRVFVRMLDAFQESWKTITDFNPMLDTIEANPEFTQVVPPNEVVVVVTFDVTIGDWTSTMNVCLPYLMLKPLAPMLSTQIWYSTGAKEKLLSIEEYERLRGNLDHTDLPITVDLGKTSMDISDFLRLKEGDIVRLTRPKDALLELKIGNLPKFLVKPGITGKRLAVRIIEEQG